MKIVTRNYKFQEASRYCKAQHNPEKIAKVSVALPPLAHTCGATCSMNSHHDTTSGASPNPMT